MHELLQEIPTGAEEYGDLVASASAPKSQEYRKVREYLDYLEDLAAGVNLEVFDRTAAQHILQERMIQAWKLTEEWINREHTRTDHQMLFKEIQRCAEKFDANPLT